MSQPNKPADYALAIAIGVALGLILFYGLSRGA
jgi:hypothetical protein